MFRWRRKSDGFEWHKYVRTTIKLRRDERKKRIEEIKDVAARKVQDAGAASATAGRVGLSAALRGLQIGLAATGRGLLAGLALVWTLMRASPGAIARTTAALARRTWPYLVEAWLIFLDVIAGIAFGIVRIAALIRRALQQPGVAPMLAGAAITAALYALARMLWSGPDTTVATAATIAAALAAFSALALREPLRLPGANTVAALGSIVVSPFAWLIDRMADGLRRSNLSVRTFGLTATAVATIALVGYGGYALWSHAPRVNPLSAIEMVTGSATRTVTGRARAISGDTLSLSGHRIRLSAIEAPELGQVCRTRRGRSWRCGRAARQQLSRQLRRNSVTCKITEADTTKLFDGTCTVRGDDLAARQVSSGYAFAVGGLIASSYGSLEQAARKAREGMWGGKVSRPADFRSRRWARAKRRAPDGCPIKGRVVRGGKVYILPWAPQYRRVRIRTRRGERWFCSEKEAIAAGWQPAPTG